MDERTLFEKFASQLSHWSRTGKEPELGDWNIKAYLELQQQRIEEKGITRTFDYKIDGKVYKVGDFVIGQLFNGYNKRLNYALGTKKIEYKKDGKTIYKEKMDIPLYQLVKWPDTDKGEWKKETYVCPNCGNIETIETFEANGCQYCGTHFTVSEMYPKVTNFYMLENMPDKKLTFDKVWKIALMALVFALFMTLSLVFDDSWASHNYTFAGVFPAVYIICLLMTIWFSPIIFNIAESIPVSIGVMGAKTRITTKLKKYDEAFSYDYFEGKALSLLRMIIFAKNPTQSVQYRGGALNPAWADIVDMDYRGGLNVTKIEQVGENIEITLKIYMKNTYYTKRRCRKKNDTMYIRMRHNIKWNVQADFSIVKVACHECGGSFDATKHRNCPYCSQEYNAGRDDWEVMEISARM